VALIFIEMNPADVDANVHPPRPKSVSRLTGRSSAVQRHATPWLSLRQSPRSRCHLPRLCRPPPGSSGVCPAPRGGQSGATRCWEPAASTKGLSRRHTSRPPSFPLPVPSSQIPASSHRLRSPSSSRCCGLSGSSMSATSSPRDPMDCT
jgi:hypothetical protein